MLHLQRAVSKTHWKYIVVVVMVVLVASAWLSTSKRKLDADPYAVFQSPDKKYMLVVYGQTMAGGFPGQGGDVPGEVVLRDIKGKTLRKQEVEMVQLVEDPEWSENGVSVKLLFDWRYR